MGVPGKDRIDGTADKTADHLEGSSALDARNCRRARQTLPRRILTLSSSTRTKELPLVSVRVKRCESDKAKCCF